ncbi:unnamed protein product [Leptosia nina]|uniref:Uncharacterized protein n=1 Tax=Leptosia nina TaxID=320188 RepID=A0AAV1JSX2_9NEOP
MSLVRASIASLLLISSSQKLQEPSENNYVSPDVFLTFCVAQKHVAYQGITWETLRSDGKKCFADVSESLVPGHIHVSQQEEIHN